jgi:two-component system, OmpR family, sensor histidine kinase VicK
MSLFGGLKKGGPGKTSLPANLRDDTLKFKVILDSIEDGVVLVDSERTIRVINPGAAKICGWPPEEATGIDIASVIKLVNEKGEAVPDQDNPFYRVFDVKQSMRGKDIFVLTRDKKSVPISLNVSPMMDENGIVTAAAAVFNDVSEERAQEQQRGDFISTASHEMRTPVAAVEGYLALALNDKVATIDSRARGYLEKAHDSTQNLGKLFQDLLTSARAEDGRLTSHPEVIEIGDFLEKLTGDLRLVAEKKGLFVDFVTANSGSHVINATKENEGGERVIRPLYYVNVDPDRLREVITNLFDNAVKYTPEGKVSLGLTGNDQVVQCYVKDTGPGIPAEDLPHLFQKFYRVDNSATRTIGGTGLGLFICRKIIELYGGRIWAESEVGKGSSFYINLPRLSTKKAAEMQTTEAGKGVVKPSIS